MTASILRKAVLPFVVLVRSTSGRIPTERLAAKDWHDLVKAYDASGDKPDLTELACAVADAWVDSWGPYVRPPTVLPLALASALDALESATRGSPLRKVKP